MLKVHKILIDSEIYVSLEVLRGEKSKLIFKAVYLIIYLENNFLLSVYVISVKN